MGISDALGGPAQRFPDGTFGDDGLGDGRTEPSADCRKRNLNGELTASRLRSIVSRRLAALIVSR
jgi:hypothetical protein